jgi:LCP family protein required for cell wall assembly
MKNRFTLISGFFLWILFFAFRVHAESIVPSGVEHVASYDVNINIGTDSNMAVTETIQYDFGNNAKPGITRYIPLNYQDLSGADFSLNITGVNVANENGEVYPIKQSDFQGANKKKYLAIAIGDGSQLVTGTKTYVINYIVSGAIRYLPDHDELFWNITGDKWPVYVAYPEVKINLPQKVDRENVSKECFIGMHEATFECIDKIDSKGGPQADYSYKGAVAGESMTVIMNFPKGIVQKLVAFQNASGTLKNDNQTQKIIWLMLFAIIVIGVFLGVYFRKELAIILIKIKHLKNFCVGKMVKIKIRKWWLAIAVVFFVAIFFGVRAIWKVESVLNKVSVKGETVGSIVQASFDNQQLKGEAVDRINILLLGILGANHPGGGLNTDTIMVASIEPKANKMSLISIPRDLWVMDPGKDTKSKINAVYAYGEEKGPGQGIADMESLVGNITNIPIDYTVIASTGGFAQLVDTLGGVEINLSKPFDESIQFEDIQVCDDDTYTILTGKYQIKKSGKKIVAQYPLCKNKNPECGANFRLPAGKNILTGQQALCFVRSRYSTSDFERAKRQQLILQQVKQKTTQMGIADFSKINSILDNLGNNVRTNLQLWEMRRLFDLYKSMSAPKIYQRVLEDSEEGLLYAPDETAETGYILLPRGDNYDKIKEVFQNIFDDKAQSDIKPSI